MPIFTRGDERIYFAHIPKTAGSAIYVLFLRNGWSLSNVETGLGPRRIGHRLHKEFGITDIPMEGERGNFPDSIQHATADVWQAWGPFSDSFAVVRNPVKRFESAMKYQYSLHKRHKTLAEFRDAQIDKISRRHDKKPSAINVHFRRQVDFVTPDTRIVAFEDGFMAKLAEMYGLENSEIEKINAAPKKIDPVLTPEVEDWIRDFYAPDFARFGYET
ncbi:sulfotransferase family protein [Celeribacter sp. ULVN23_4]